MNFYCWVVANYAGKDTPEGDFVNDMERSIRRYEEDLKFWSDLSSVEVLESHLMIRGACREAIKTTKGLYKKYKSLTIGMQ